jgi:hypothetical protein
VVVATLLLTLALSVEPAAAKTHTFSPVKKTSKALVFKPRGLTPKAVRKARLKVRVAGRTRNQRVRTNKVRHAIRRGRKVRFRRPRRRSGARVRGALRVRVASRLGGGRRPKEEDPGRPADPRPPSEESPAETPPAEEQPAPVPPEEEAPSAEPAEEGASTEEPSEEETAEPGISEEEPELPSDSTPSGDEPAGSGSEPPPPETSCTLGSFSASTMPGSCWRPYSEDSPFNRRLPADPPLASNSEAIISRWADQPDSNMFKFGGGDADTPNDYDHPVYFNSPSDPLYTIHCRRWTSSCEVDGSQVRIPSEARAAQGSDAHMTVIDQASGWEYDFWEAEDLPSGGGTLFIGHGGRTEIEGDGLDSNATASHFGGAAGIIRPEELAAGEVRHALFLVVECTNDSSVFPAGDGHGRSCSSIGKSNSGAPAMGQHLYLDMGEAEIDALSAPAWQKTILRAMADYGLFVGDTGGGSLKTLSGTSYTSFGYADPWVELGEQFGVHSWTSSSDGKRKYLFDLRETINWEAKLRVVDPCVAQGSC